MQNINDFVAISSIKQQYRARFYLSKAWMLAFLLLGAGQLLPFRWFYPGGVSIGDIIFLILMMVEISFFVKKGEASKIFIRTKFILMAMGLIVFSLILGVVLNYQHYIIFRPEYVLSILRLIYFAIMVPMVAFVVVNRLSVEMAVKYYLIGLITALILNALNDFVWSVPNERCGLYIWANPNVIGNIACIGLLFNILWLREGGRPYVGFVSTFFLLSFAALLSFSKATWVMLFLIGILAAIISYKGSQFPMKEVRRIGFFAIAVFLAFIFLEFNKIECYVDTKLKSSPPSLAIRKNYAISAKNILLEHPLGIGVGRYYEYSNGVPASIVEAAQTGFSSAGNPHSAFLNLAITGGWGALLGFVGLIYGAAHAFLTAMRGSGSKILIFLIGALYSLVLIVSASFQLQIMTVNFLYVLVGILVALNLKESRQKEVYPKI